MKEYLTLVHVNVVLIQYQLTSIPQYSDNIVVPEGSRALLEHILVQSECSLTTILPVDSDVM